MNTEIAGEERRSVVRHSYGIDRAGTVKLLGWILALIGIAGMFYRGSVILERPRTYATCLEVEAEAARCEEYRLGWEEWITMVGSIGTMGLGIIQIHHGATSRLTLTPEGVEYYNGLGFYRLTTAWENVAAIKHRDWPIGDYLALRAPGQVHVTGLARLTIPQPEMRRIPLLMFMKGGRNSGIDADLKRYAPQLLSEARS